MEGESAGVGVPQTLITWYLHMTDPAQFRPAFLQPLPDVQLMRLERADAPYYLFLYTGVGEALRWRDRLIMPREELQRLIARPNVCIQVLYVDGAPAGYYELLNEDGDVALDYFGLRPAYHGRGLGGHLLSAAIAQAWQQGARRIWVHTCNLDGPAALPNYQRRGFSIYRTVEEMMPQRYQ